MEDIEIEKFMGMTFTAITGEKGGEELRFHADNGNVYVMYHSQSCCESVYLEDVIGDLQDLVGSPILRAEEAVHSDETPIGIPQPEGYNDSYTWTFYKLATAKGYVDLRWFGSSNGYYGEGITISRVQ